MADESHPWSGITHESREILVLLGLTALALVFLNPETVELGPWGIGILLSLVASSWLVLGSRLLARKPPR